MRYKGLYENYFKRLLDIVLSALALVILSPLLLTMALLIKIKLGSPVVFKQARPGLHEKIFYLYKFRSMTNEIGEDGRLLPDAQRLTRFGKFLRTSSLDELLELVNIIKGDMSIVGPRPLSIYYLPHYPKDFRRRHNVRPGLTGLAQVNGRNNLPWDERFTLDINYVNHLTLFLDVKIILDTILKVIKHADVSVRGMAKVMDYGPYSIMKEENSEDKKEQDMMYSEIGSYFWLDHGEIKGTEETILWLPDVNDSCFTFSGRNAIDIALRDILRNRKVNKIYAPSYCCISMLQAFIDHRIKIEFYNIGYTDGKFVYEVPETDGRSIVLIMSYFGLNWKTVHEAIRKLHDTGAIVIEDITHSLLGDISYSKESDYLVASLRKWFAVPAGGWVGKRKGMLDEKPSLDSNHAVVEKIAGMREKFDYLTGKIATKENFLLAQAKFDNDLIHVDRMLRIDDTSLNILRSINVVEVIEKHRRNTEILLAGLKDLNGKVLSFPAVNLKEDVPLFMPVFMDTKDRDSLRNYLLGKGIYCPVHWPEVMGAPAGIRENELSLICDQRYSDRDMQTIVGAIHDWYKG